MDAVFYGKSYDLIHLPILKSYSHGEKYYSVFDPLKLNTKAFHEMIGNYTVLKLNDSFSGIELLRETFGDEFVDMLEDTFQKMLHEPLFADYYPVSNEIVSFEKNANGEYFNIEEKIHKKYYILQASL